MTGGAGRRVAAGVPSASARATSTALAAQISPVRATSASAAAASAASLAAVEAAAISLEAALARAASSATGVAAAGSAAGSLAGGSADSAGAADGMTPVAALLIVSGYRGGAASLAPRKLELSPQICVGFPPISTSFSTDFIGQGLATRKRGEQERFDRPPHLRPPGRRGYS